MSRKQFDYKQFNRLNSTNKVLDAELNKIWSVIRQMFKEDHIYDIPNKEIIGNLMPEVIPDRLLCKDDTGLYLKTKNDFIRIVSEDDLLRYVQDSLSYVFGTDFARPRIEYGYANANEVIFFNKSYRKLLTIVTGHDIIFSNITGFIMGEQSGNWISLGED